MAGRPALSGRFRIGQIHPPLSPPPGASANSNPERLGTRRAQEAMPGRRLPPAAVRGSARPPVRPGARRATAPAGSRSGLRGSASAVSVMSPTASVALRTSGSPTTTLPARPPARRARCRPGPAPRARPAGRRCGIGAPRAGAGRRSPCAPGSPRSPISLAAAVSDSISSRRGPHAAAPPPGRPTPARCRVIPAAVMPAARQLLGHRRPQRHAGRHVGIVDHDPGPFGIAAGAVRHHGRHVGRHARLRQPLHQLGPRHRREGDLHAAAGHRHQLGHELVGQEHEDRVARRLLQGLEQRRGTERGEMHVEHDDHLAAPRAAAAAGPA